MLRIVAESFRNPRKPRDHRPARRKIHADGKIEAIPVQPPRHAEHPEQPLFTPPLVVDQYLIDVGIHACDALRQRHGQHRDAGIRMRFAQGADGRGHEDEIADEREVDDQDVLIQTAPLFP